MGRSGSHGGGCVFGQNRRRAAAVAAFAHATCAVMPLGHTVVVAPAFFDVRVSVDVALPVTRLRHPATHTCAPAPGGIRSRVAILLAPPPTQWYFMGALAEGVRKTTISCPVWEGDKTAHLCTRRGSGYPERSRPGSSCTGRRSAPRPCTWAHVHATYVRVGLKVVDVALAPPSLHGCFALIDRGFKVAGMALCT